MPDRLRELLRIAARGTVVDLRANEPAIVWDCFFQNGHLRRVGELFLDHRPAHGARQPKPPTRSVFVRNQKPYEIALSFAGEDRAFVEAVARELRTRGISVFYDAFEQATILGKDLTAHLADVYGKLADFCAIFVSCHYARKTWPDFERQHAQARALAEKREYILPIRLDDSEVLGLSPTIAYLDARIRSASEIAEILIEKIRKSKIRSPA